jgi:hypothetical protein
VGVLQGNRTFDHHATIDEEFQEDTLVYLAGGAQAYIGLHTEGHQSAADFPGPASASLVVYCQGGAPGYAKVPGSLLEGAACRKAVVQG